VDQVLAYEDVVLSFAISEGEWSVGQRLLSGRRDTVDCREIPREVRASERGSNDANGGRFGQSAALGGAGERPGRGGRAMGSGFCRQWGGEWT
jgi:hypothetical protein